MSKKNQLVFIDHSIPQFSIAPELKSDWICRAKVGLVVVKNVQAVVVKNLDFFHGISPGANAYIDRHVREDLQALVIFDS